MSQDADDGGADGRVAADAFVRLLDAYGGEPSRWPQEHRRMAEAVLKRTDAAGLVARSALAEARALDAVLAVAPLPLDAARVAALADRIVATTRRAPRAANVVVLDDARRRPMAPIAAKGTLDRRWAAAALLAASLLLGVFVGPASDSLPALQETADALGLGAFTEQLALGPGEDGGVHDEDTL